MKRGLMIMTALAALSFVTACNTVEGAGEDLQQAGSSIERSSQTGYNKP